MAKVIAPHFIKEVQPIAPHLLKFPSSKFMVDYDKAADVLYISFNRPQNATDSRMQKNGMILRYRNKDLVGITILDASKRK
ncbi:MAG: DUF2283 domain-containing protein [Candidatus Edwardsbacteria bacterium]|nr:DUF2283 domain-containing protein [Candidatus Edwardsbacteria bacterium]